MLIIATIIGPPELPKPMPSAVSARTGPIFTSVLMGEISANAAADGGMNL